MPKVSVIIPVYNAEEYLYDCLDSIINQTLKDIEIICVNDGSSDKSLEILNEYASNDGRFIILTQDNQGAGVARNKGLDNANGEFVSFIDPDDFYPNYNTLEILYNTANEKKVLACAGSLMELRDGKYCIPRREGFCFPQNGMVDFIDYQFIYGYTRYIFNLDFLKSNKLYFPPYRRFQDPVFLLKTLHKMKRFYTIKDYTYVYRIQEHDGEYYSDRIMTDLAKGMKDVITYAKENNLRKVTMRMRNKIFIKFYLDMFENFKVDGVDCLYYLFEPRSFTDEQIENISEKFENKSIMSKFKSREYIQYFFKNGGRIDEYEEDMDKPDFITMWGNALWNPQPETLKYALENDIPVIKAEDGFLRSADTWCNTITDKKYTNCIAFTFTNDVLYFDATRSSYTERQINDTKFKLTEEQLQRTKKAINFIIKNHLTKYNHQPIYTPQIGRKGVPKILVVDQSYGDYSIRNGLASEETFKDMLESAIKENPDADIIIKTHPDALAPGTGKASGYYSTIEPHDNIYVLREPINPISLIKYVDKVYVCTTQLGFEALMCGKEVHTFGMPYYAGWGLTIDKLKCPRRTAIRTLEEIFYIMYIKNSYYIDPEKKRECSIEEAMKYLLKLRTEYSIYKKLQKVKQFVNFVGSMLFSIKEDNLHIIVQILGFKFKHRSKRLSDKAIIEELEQTLKKQSGQIRELKQTIKEKVSI